MASPTASIGDRLWRRCSLVGILLGLVGCTTTLEPPRLDDGAQKIHLMDHGRHPSLVLPDGRGGSIRYAYGDWTWFAEGRTGFVQGVAALLWPTPAALGRQRLKPWDSPAGLRRQIKEGFLSLYTLQVPRGAALQLARRLEAIYRAGDSRGISNPTLSLTFVPHPDAYWGLHNSNVVTAEWLESLGVEVRGTALLSRWVVADR